jgi:DNA-directed RNA polymerase
LLRHTADVYDGLSRPTDRKIDFGKSIAPKCMEIASDPIKNINKWKDADKPFGFLRSCMEVRDAITPILRYQLEHGDKDQLKKTTRQETVAKARKWIKDHSADLKELETEDTSDHVVEDNHGNEVRLPHHSITWGSGLHSAYKDRHFVARMPVAIDQSNSAFQHIALMMDSKSLAEQTNLDNDSFHDIYQEVGDELGLKRKIIKVIIVPWSYGASTQKIQQRVIDYVDENPDKSGALSEQTEEKIKKEVKRVTKTLRKRFKVCLEYQKKVKQTIEHEFEKRSGGETLTDFNKRQEDAVAEIKRIKKLQRTKRNTDRIKEIKESIRPPSGAIEWRTPFDFVVHQRIHVAEEPQGIVANGFAEKNEKGEIPDVDLKVRRPTDDIDWNGTRTKAPPNLVHAYDSALIHGTLWTGRFYIGQDEKGNRTAFGNPWHDDEELPVTDAKMGDPDQGLGPIVAVHDSFACHASMLEELKQVLLFNFEQIYNDFDPLERFQAEITGRKAKERKRKFKYQKSKHWAG